MRQHFEEWERGLLCELWHRVELRILDTRERTPSWLLHQMQVELQRMRMEYRPQIAVGTGRVIDGTTGLLKLRAAGLAEQSDARWYRRHGSGPKPID